MQSTKCFLILFISIIPITTYCQIFDDIKACQVDSLNGEKVYNTVETPPEFKDGGLQGFYKCISENIKLDKDHATLGCVKVVISFIVDENGNIQNICKTNNIVITEEILKKLDNWKAGTQNGIPVPVRMILPIYINTG